MNKVVNNKADNTANLVTTSGKPVWNVFYEERRCLIGKLGTMRAQWMNENFISNTTKYQYYSNRNVTCKIFHLLVYMFVVWESNAGFLFSACQLTNASVKSVGRLQIMYHSPSLTSGNFIQFIKNETHQYFSHSGSLRNLVRTHTFVLRIAQSHLMYKYIIQLLQ